VPLADSFVSVTRRTTVLHDCVTEENVDMVTAGIKRCYSL